jgi:hypothetical protein
VEIDKVVSILQICRGQQLNDRICFDCNEHWELLNMDDSVIFLGVKEQKIVSVRLQRQTKAYASMYNLICSLSAQINTNEID